MSTGCARSFEASSGFKDLSKLRCVLQLRESFSMKPSEPRRVSLRLKTAGVFAQEWRAGHIVLLRPCHVSADLNWNRQRWYRRACRREKARNFQSARLWTRENR